MSEEEKITRPSETLGIKQTTEPLHGHHEDAELRPAYYIGRIALGTEPIVDVLREMNHTKDVHIVADKLVLPVFYRDVPDTESLMGQLIVKASTYRKNIVEPVRGVGVTGIDIQSKRRNQKFVSLLLDPTVKERLCDDAEWLNRRTINSGYGGPLGYPPVQRIVLAKLPANVLAMAFKDEFTDRINALFPESISLEPAQVFPVPVEK